MFGTPFQLPRLYPILDTSCFDGPALTPVTMAQILLSCGARILQYRHKASWTQDNFDQARKIANLCEDAGALFVVNDRADYARLLGAALHVGQEDLPPVAARKVICEEVMGFSTHNRLQVIRGNEEPVEYLALGPIFPTRSKANPDPAVGIEGVRILRALTEKPMVAIGGITLENARDVLQAGADSVAVISGLLPPVRDVSSIKARAQEWLRAVA
jgi:thiamine-phosphate pyrophosphorylase